jgi:hypothetical protein
MNFNTTGYERKLRERAYYYYKNGLCDNAKINYERARKVQKKIDRWVYNRSVTSISPEGYNTDRIYLCADCDVHLIKKLYRSTTCCNHKNREAKFYFYYRTPDCCVPGLGPFCDDCLGELDDDKVKNISNMIKNIINLCTIELVDSILK